MMKKIRSSLFSLFINKPMKWHYVVTILIHSIFLLFYFISTHKIFDLLGILSFIFLIGFAYINYKEINTDLGTIKIQMLKNVQRKDIEYWCTLGINFLTYIFIFILYVSIESCKQYFIFDLKWLVSILLVYRLVFDLIKIAPFISFIYIVIPITVLSVIGINDSLLNWTFVSLILVTIVNHLLTNEIQYFLSKRERKIAFKKHSLKIRLFRIKCKILLFIPLLYCSLLFSEIISKSEIFLYLINRISHTNLEMGENSLLSFFNFYTIAIKLLFLTFSIVIWGEYSDSILKKIARLLVTKKNSNFHNITNSHKPNHSIWIFFILLLSTSIVVSQLLYNDMRSRYRGSYYLLVKDEEKNYKIDNNKKLSFQNQKIKIEGEEFFYDNASMTIKDKNKEKVGEINDSEIRINIQDKNLIYVLEDSDKYKN
ncbi:hypothetical protein [Streptococcus sp. 1453]|uniref:hypothetical protein n=1 Tax=Streptococcus sp. 1453 TaxID=2582661 RepID=UPI001591C43D|nr:hypothetical protein [Streptococcus sp. 1453]